MSVLFDYYPSLMIFFLVSAVVIIALLLGLVKTSAHTFYAFSIKLGGEERELPPHNVPVGGAVSLALPVCSKCINIIIVLSLGLCVNIN